MARKSNKDKINSHIEELISKGVRKDSIKKHNKAKGRLKTNRIDLMKPPDYPAPMWKSIQVEFFFSNEVNYLVQIIKRHSNDSVTVQMRNELKTINFIPKRYSLVRDKNDLLTLISTYHPLEFGMSLFHQIYRAEAFVIILKKDKIKYKHKNLIKRTLFLSCLITYVMSVKKSKDVSIQHSLDAVILIIIYVYYQTNPCSYLKKESIKQLEEVIKPLRSDTLSGEQLFFKHFADIIKFDFNQIDIDNYKKDPPYQYNQSKHPSLLRIKRLMRHRLKFLQQKSDYYFLCKQTITQTLINL